jgi:hypothetical protein
MPEGVRTSRRWRLLVLASTVAVTPPARLAMSAEPESKVYVYLPSLVRPPMLEKALGEALPEVSVVVFRHLRHFEATIVESPPDFVIGARPLLDQHERWMVIAQGVVGGRPEEPCVLVSVGQAVDAEQAAQAGIGVVDLLGKKAMPVLVASLLGISTPPKLTRVGLPEDLLPLLELNLAKAVLMPAREFPVLREKSALDLRATELKSAWMGLPALAAVPGTQVSADMQRRFMNLPPKVKAMLGVDDWRRP